MARAATLLLLAGGVSACLAQTAPGSIFTCTDAQGRRLTSDRLIPACMDREQRVLNRDGSLQRIVPPAMTADERSTKEAQERKAAAERAARAEAVRADRNLMMRYADEAAHEKARTAAVDRVRDSLAESKKRLDMLAAERKPLLSEAEFYQGKSLPPKLKHQFDANDAATEAQRLLVANAEAELVRINQLYDTELARLKKLWGGAAPGSMGPLTAPEPVAAAANARPPSKTAKN